MNFFRLTFLFLCSHSAFSQQVTRLTKEVLDAKRQAVVSSQTEQRPIELVSNSKTSIRNSLQKSDIIAFNGKWTFLPKGAIIHIPKQFEARVVREPQGEMLSFPEFLRKNYAWVKTETVTEEQILEEDEAAKLKEKFVKSGFLVVATRNGSPVSVQKGNNPKS